MDQTPEIAASWLELFDRFGVSIVILGLFIAGTAYGLKRLLNKDDGILTNYGKTVESAHQQLVTSYERLESTDRVMADLLKGHSVQLDQIEVHVVDTEEGVSGLQDAADAATKKQDATTAMLLRCADRACNVIEQLSAKLDAESEVAPHIAEIRSELRGHRHEHE